MILLLLQQTIVGLIATIFLISSTKADLKNCNRTCGIGNQNRHHHHDNIPYPFGFSDGCPIQLSCTAGIVSIGEFEVQKFTGDSLLINLPAKCDRPIKDIEGLFGMNYALTWQNGLLLQNCTSQPKNCVIPIGLIQRGLESQPQGCDSGRDNISCYSFGHQGHDFMSFDNLNSTSCEVLFSSIAVDMRNNSNLNSVFSLEFQTVELGWWLDGGQCRCSSNANCTVVSLAHGRGEGFRCSCNEGFEGDGFTDGRGCRKGNSRLCGGIPELKLPKCDNTKKNPSLSRLHILLISVGTALLGIVSAASFLFYWLKRTRKVKTSGSILKEPFLKVSYEMLLKATDGFSSTNLIGAGSFGSVYKAILNGDEKIIAVKVLNLQRRGATKSFMAECEALRNIRHRNLVKTITSCSSIDFQGNDFKALVYEFMPNGSLERWLHTRTTRSDGGEEETDHILTLHRRINIAVDVACAVDYLHHHCGKPIIHCDIKPSNVLLDGDMVAHVGDFGLSRFFPQLPNQPQSSSIGVRGTIGYAAPEYGLGSEVSTNGDVYSYGILLLEMMTGKRPTNPMFQEGLDLHKFARMALPDQVLEILDPVLLVNNDDDDDDEAGENNNTTTSPKEGTSGKRKENCLISILKIGVACSVESPQERMDISSVVHELHSIKNILN